MLLAVIRENECIGCTKCIQACPVDAILGSENWMHTVITDECIACKLCLPPCPVDCIDLVPAPADFILKDKQHIILRSKARKERLKNKDAELAPLEKTETRDERKAYILEALKRKKQKL